MFKEEYYFPKHFFFLLCSEFSLQSSFLRKLLWGRQRHHACRGTNSVLSFCIFCTNKNKDFLTLSLLSSFSSGIQHLLSPYTSFSTGLSVVSLFCQRKIKTFFGVCLMRFDPQNVNMLVCQVFKLE